VLDLNAGQIAVTFAAGDNTGRQATFGEMKQLDPVFGSTHSSAEIAGVLGLREEDIAEQTPRTVSTGLPFCITVLRSLEGLKRLRLDPMASEEHSRNSDAKFFYTLASESDGVWRARMQFYNDEDPATGSAAGCAISYLVKYGLCAPGERLHIRQGIEIKRPSDLYVSANFANGKVNEVRVRGSTVPVARGRLFLA
jgi:trans-2,3-dihydro-3-hydroxyanthranilate isomerase